ncbi:MAG: sulfocyanin-like copper-binding protein [Nostoc sp.]
MAWLQILRRNYVIITLLLGLNFIVATPAMAANLSEDLLKQPATEIRVSLGNSANELKPGAEAEWVFVPRKSGTYSLRCSIPGHTEAGMTGEIAIKN